MTASSSIALVIIGFSILTLEALSILFLTICARSLETKPEAAFAKVLSSGS